MIHDLKILPEYFEAIISGKKTFEVRKRDRDYKIGDLLVLNEIDVQTIHHTGNKCLVSVEYILDNDAFCKEGYIIMGIRVCHVMFNEEGAAQ